MQCRRSKCSGGQSRPKALASSVRQDAKLRFSTTSGSGGRPRAGKGEVQGGPRALGVQRPSEGQGRLRRCWLELASREPSVQSGIGKKRTGLRSDTTTHPSPRAVGPEVPAPARPATSRQGVPGDPGNKVAGGGGRGVGRAS